MPVEALAGGAALTGYRRTHLDRLQQCTMKPLFSATLCAMESAHRGLPGRLRNA